MNGGKLLIVGRSPIFKIFDVAGSEFALWAWIPLNRTDRSFSWLLISGEFEFQEISFIIHCMGVNNQKPKKFNDLNFSSRPCGTKPKDLKLVQNLLKPSNFETTND
jgi:hypothetical protein